MKTTKWFVVAFVMISSFPVLAQQANANTQQSTSVQAGTAQASESTLGNANAKATGKKGTAQAQGSGSANGSASLTSPHTSQPAASQAANLHSMHAAASGATSTFANGEASFQPVSGELVGKLDSKSAKVGDEVVMKTTQAFRTADGTVVPKGTHLVGHVTRVQAHRAKDEDGDLGIQFDRALLKGGRELPIHSVIESVAPSPAAMAMASSGSDDLADGSGMIGGSAMSGGRMVAGGGRSLASGGALSGAGSMAAAPARVVNTSFSGAGNGMANAGGNTLGATGNLASGATASANTLRGPMAGSSLMAAHATAIPGVMLAGDAAGSASGVLSASRRNVHLDGGTQMVLGVAAAAQR